MKRKEKPSPVLLCEKTEQGKEKIGARRLTGIKSFFLFCDLPRYTFCIISVWLIPPTVPQPEGR